MIAQLRGEVWEALPGRVVVGAGGVGYLVMVSLATYDALRVEVGASVKLLTFQHVRENDLSLYGFAQESERELFLLLCQRVSGIGPTTALSVLNGMSVEDFKRAVVGEDAEVLARIRGLGKKTAQRIILELKDKVGVGEVWEKAAQAGPKGVQEDALLGLLALGYKQAEARKAVEKAALEAPEAEAGTLLREALRRI